MEKERKEKGKEDSGRKGNVEILKKHKKRDSETRNEENNT